MGCGILFPREYSAEADCDGVDKSDSREDLVTEGDEDNCLGSDSEDDEWWERRDAENGTKVQVGRRNSNRGRYY